MNPLDQVDFGVGAAHNEQHLADYFYRSGAFQAACSAKTYLILGAKGAGKSSIFRMLQELREEIQLFQPPNLWLPDEPRLRDYAATLRRIGITSAVTLWRFYVATLIIAACLSHPQLPEELKKAYQRFLVRWGLLCEIPTWWQTVKQVKWSVGFKDYAKIEAPADATLTPNEIDYVIVATDQWLNEIGANLWLGLDSLDEVETNGSTHDKAEDLQSGLMRAVGELTRLKRIRFKLFFRTDVYQTLTYVNKDHFSGVKLELRWSKEDLAVMLAHRLHVLHSDHTAAITYPMARKWIDEFFDWPGTGLLKSFDDLYCAMRDGNGDVLPRDLVNFCISAQKLQQSYNIQGIEAAAPSSCISGASIRRAFLQTAESKLNDFLPVFQNFNETYERLRGGQSRTFNRAEFSNAIGKKDPLDANLVIADLVRVGALTILDDKAVNLSDAFEIPLLYAVALRIDKSHERI
jgi:hypothetical protein